MRRAECVLETEKVDEMIMQGYLLGVPFRTGGYGDSRCMVVEDVILVGFSPPRAGEQPQR
jgi:hypothetical protein